MDVAPSYRPPPVADPCWLWNHDWVDNRRAMDLVDELLGRSSQMIALREQIRSLLAREAEVRNLPPILITGETGTGKGLVARILHRGSSRAKAEFVEVNGAAIPEHLLESELFGYERGAFTDARQPKAGLLQVAHRGTFFLDEVGLLPLAFQAKLLKVVEDGLVRRVGSTRSEAVDICIVSATNEDLALEVRNRRFRQDLYQRLAVITLRLPSLRERVEDIDLLVKVAMARTCAKYSGPARQLSPEALSALRGYRWPGNVRELNSLIERTILLCPTPVIPVAALGLGATPELGTADVDVDEFQRRRLSDALARTGWNISRTAALLGVTRNTVRARIARYGLRSITEPEGARIPPADTHPGESQEPAAAPGDLVDAAPSSGESADASVIGAGLRRGRPSIAVLPFRVENEPKSYLGDGIVDDIVGALASLRELLVISRSSTLRYRGATVDVRAVGREMSVSYALSGSVRQAGPRMRVSVELAETTGGAVVWASHFDGMSDDLFALQDQIATRVVGTLAPQVREAELRHALRKRPDNLEAYDYALRALSQIYQLNRDDFAEARTWLEKAIALDPAYAMPYALLAIWHSIRVGQGWSPDITADHAAVLRLATAAIARDSFDAMALALCGHSKSILRYEFEEALVLFDRAIEASPSSAIAWTRSSSTYSYIGAPAEAIRRVEEGLRLSPLDPHIFLPHAILTLGHYVAGAYDEAAGWGRKSREENPQYTANLRLLAASLAASGQTEEAGEVGRALLAADPTFQVGRFVDRYAIRDPDRRDRLAQHLRLAGLPG
jgi:DNA-binding NtrC family response regulator/TolB-like protein/tetratricopeptide (TPR) repeat protein